MRFDTWHSAHPPMPEPNEELLASGKSSYVPVPWFEPSRLGNPWMRLTHADARGSEGRTCGGGRAYCGRTRHGWLYAQVKSRNAVETRIGEHVAVALPTAPRSN